LRSFLIEGNPNTFFWSGASGISLDNFDLKRTLLLRSGSGW